MQHGAPEGCAAARKGRPAGPTVLAAFKPAEPLVLVPDEFYFTGAQTVCVLVYIHSSTVEQKCGFYFQGNCRFLTLSSWSTRGPLFPSDVIPTHLHPSHETSQWSERSQGRAVGLGWAWLIPAFGGCCFIQDQLPSFLSCPPGTVLPRPLH